MKTLAIVAFSLLSVICYAQNAPTGETKSITFRTISPEDKFQSDLKRNAFTIYTLGGLMPSNYDTDKAFQEKYNVNYHDFGCIAPPDMKFYITYNKLVFDYLKEKWGTEWQNDIKDNAMGLYNWKQL